jgi:NAD(P)-dependent dehydrogenase (short-subunit alcohol dehydrogenase family)
VAGFSAAWDTNVFGVLSVYQAMLPLLHATPGSRIVNISRGVGSLAYPYRAIFGPVYPACKTALNALTVAMGAGTGAGRNQGQRRFPGYTKTNLNGYSGTETVEEGARG